MKGTKSRKSLNSNALAIVDDPTRYSVTAEMCPDCESVTIDEMNIQDELSLSNEEMERGGNAIIAARDYACGYIDAAKYLDVLTNNIIPMLRNS